MRTSLSIPYEDLAFAYELRTEGICWKLIASSLGVECDSLKHAIGRVKKYGMKKAP